MAVALVTVLFASSPFGNWEQPPVALWIAFASLFAIFESSDLLFYYKKGRQSVSPGEAILLPMLFALPAPATVCAVTTAVVIVAAIRWRLRGTKLLFNVAQYGCAAAAAAGTWTLLVQGDKAFTVVNAGVAALCVVVFGLATHAFTVIAICLAETRRVTELSREIGAVTVLTLLPSITIGLFFGASVVAATWTVALFPMALGVLHLGAKAMARQRADRERVEHLHDATRALASSPDVEHAIIGFLKAVSDVMSCTEARVVVSRRDGAMRSAVRAGDVYAVHEIAAESDACLLRRVERVGMPIKSVDRSDRDGSVGIDAGSFVAVPVREENEVVGCLVALDRLGADDFDDADVRLLEALANELAVALDSYRLFSEVAEERERFRRIFDGSKEGICLLDDRGVVRAWNPALTTMTGYSEEELLGNVWSDHVMVRDSVQRRIEGPALVQRSGDEELEVVTREGPTRWISVLPTELQTGDDKGFVVLVRDRTAEHTAEQAKSDFLATISHELRTPLTTIKGSAQVLSRGAENLPPGTVDQMVDVVRRGADRLERLVMNLLTVSQMETGQIQAFAGDVDLNELVSDLVRRVPGDRITVRIASEGDIVVRADRERLTQCIDAVLDNAGKYGGGGSIAIEITPGNGYARISVTDEGPGIPASDQNRIFERFVRLGEVNTRETQGAGVGLFIARRSIEAMEGSIWVDSEPGRGATFHLEVPLARPVLVGQAKTA